MTQPDLFSSYVQLPSDHAHVYAYIQPRRKANGITQTELAELTGFSPRAVRQLCKEMIEDYGLNIGSGPTGFYIVTEAAEIERIYNDWVSRAYSILRRAKAFRRNCDLDGVLGQLQLHLKA